MTPMLEPSDEDSDTPVITMLHVVKENTLEVNGKIEILCREIEITKNS